MKKLALVGMLFLALGSVPLLAQEKNQMPMNQGMQMDHDGMKGGGMMGDQMKEMQAHMAEMRKRMAGTKGDDVKGMGKGMQEMSGMMGDMGKMMEGGKMTPEEMQTMSKMMGDMSGMMKQMSDRMKTGAKKSQ
jgi:hypothetical protein